MHAVVVEFFSAIAGQTLLKQLGNVAIIDSVLELCENVC